MEGTVAIIFVFAAVNGINIKHTYVPDAKNWAAARSYCREHYTDLAYVSCEQDTKELIDVSSGKVQGWIGLCRERYNSTVWTWSGGEKLTYKNWYSGQPDNYKYLERCVEIIEGGVWNDVSETVLNPFYCSTRFIVVKERKSWQEALEHCGKTQYDLVSLVSDIEMLTINREIQKLNIIGGVWIGLHFLAGKWLWTNGDELSYMNWAPDNQKCPHWSRSCGAVTEDGLWKNLNCERKLSFICS